MTVSGGLVNSAGSTLYATGTDVFNAALENAGTLQVQSANVTFNGLVTSDAGSSLSISGSTVNPGSLYDLSTANMAAVSLSNSTVNCPGTFFNAAGITLDVTNAVFNGAVENQGTMVVQGDSNFINGALTTDAGSIIDILEGNTDGDANLTVANAFINSGLIDLSETLPERRVFVEADRQYGDVLVNDVGIGTIKSTQLGGDLYGSRVLAATVENRGTMSLVKRQYDRRQHPTRRSSTTGRWQSCPETCSSTAESHLHQQRRD